MLKAEIIWSWILVQAWWILFRLSAEFCHNVEMWNRNPQLCHPHMHLVLLHLMYLSIGAQDYVIKSMCEKSVKHVCCTFSIMLLFSVNLSKDPRTLPALHVWNYQCGAWKGRICEYSTFFGFNRQLTFLNEPFSIRQRWSEPVRAVGVVTSACLPMLELVSQAGLCLFVSHNVPIGLWCFQLM